VERIMTNDSIATVEAVYRMDWRRGYPQNPVRVWAAISDEQEISVWTQYPTKLEPRPGGKIHIDFSSQESLEGIVCNAEPLRLLTYTWGDSLVKWEMEEAGGETRVHLSHIGVRRELVDGLGAGWHAFLDQLEDYLAGSSRVSRYRELKSRYEAVTPKEAKRPAPLAAFYNRLGSHGKK
jgi:uncharacterized protein YndB with AHSA1/START domain